MCPTTSQFLRTERIDAENGTVLRATINRPEKLNALPNESLAHLAEIVENVSQDDVQVVEVTGAGSDFSVGADLSGTEDIGEDRVIEGVETTHHLVEALRHCPVPVVATVSGRAFGAGFIICMAADIVIAASDASFGLQEINLGIPVAGYVSAMLPQIVGEHVARDWLFSGRIVDASEAEQRGFISYTVAPDELDSAVADTLQQLTSSSPFAIQSLKDRLAAGFGNRRDVTALREREVEEMKNAFRKGDIKQRLKEFRL